MRTDRICRYVILLVGFSILPIFILYFKLPATRITVKSHNVVPKLPAFTDILLKNETNCELTAEDHRSYPNCAQKMSWLQEHWQDNTCFEQFGVNGSMCSSRFYLSYYEDHCPTIGKTRKYQSFEANTNLTELFDLMTDIPENYVFMKKRTEGLWPKWIEGLQEMKKKYGRQFDNYQKLNIIVHLGFLMTENKLNFASKSDAGGPLGELVQWSDLIAALHILGHNIFLTTNKNALLQNIHHFGGDSPCPGERHLDLIVTDIMGFLRVFRRQKAFASQNSCKFRFVDSFGTQAEFNNKQYFLKSRRSFGGSTKNPWGGHGLRLKQYWTFYPHTSDNSFLGFVIEKDDKQKALFSRKKNKSVLIYGKEQYMWANMTDVIRTLQKSHQVHATVADAAKGNLVFDKVNNHGFLNQMQLSSLLKSVRAFVGLGFPLEGPAPLEAIASGAAFINPLFDPPQSRANTRFLSEKPTLRKWTSQVPYLEKLGEPYVYTVDIHNETQLRHTLERIDSENRSAFVPSDFRPIGMLLRVNNMLLNEDLCAPQPRYPPRRVLQIKTGQESCDEICGSYSLVCEPAFFPFINREDVLKKHFLCSAIESEEWVHAPYDCVLQSKENLFSCSSPPPKDSGQTRLCPCRDSHPEFSSFCQSCL